MVIHSKKLVLDVIRLYMSYSLKSLKGGYEGSILRVIKGNNRSFFNYIAQRVVS